MPVWHHLTASQRMLCYADTELRDLDRLTFDLRSNTEPTRTDEQVARAYTNYLVQTRQVAVSIDKAGKIAGNPPPFAQWWTSLLDDPTHAFFRAERNAVLKEGAEPIAIRPLTGGLAYWAFPKGPHAGEPLVPRCQLYNEWLYDRALAPAREKLFEWTLPERQAGPFSLA